MVLPGSGHIILALAKLSDGICPVAAQHNLPELDREGREALENDKPRLIEMVKHQDEKWNLMVQSALDAVDRDMLNIWPFYSVPPLDTWKSTKSRVVILGYAAHGLPPVGALDANLAFEDVQSLVLALACVNEGHIGWRDCLEWWQEDRQTRIKGVMGNFGCREQR